MAETLVWVQENNINDLAELNDLCKTAQANAQAASHFTDVTPGAWYYTAVTEASVGHTFTELTGIERWTALA